MSAAVDDVCVGMPGARERYAAARALAERGRLMRLFTDLWCPVLPALFAMRGGALARLAGRFHPRLVGHVTSFPLGALRLAAGARGRGTADSYARYAEAGEWFSRRVLGAMRRRGLRPRAYLGFTSAALETFEGLKRSGCACVLDQIDAGPLHYRLLREERQRWPGWDASEGDVPEPYWDRVRGEWAAADRIVVNSEWTRDALLGEGVPAEKLDVIPLCIEPDAAAGGDSAVGPGVPGRLRVLWVGSVNLMKGFPYFVEALRMTPAGRVTVEVAGSVQVSAAALARLPAGVRVRGSLPRSDTAALYRTADVLVAPTLSDGFGLTQLEAMTFGVPVITTPNCGRVVEDGVEGFVVPARDSGAIAASLARLCEEPELLARMKVRATQKARDFSLQRFGDRLTACIDLAIAGRTS